VRPFNDILNRVFALPYFGDLVAMGALPNPMSAVRSYAAMRSLVAFSDKIGIPMEIPHLVGVMEHESERVPAFGALMCISTSWVVESCVDSLREGYSSDLVGLIPTEPDEFTPEEYEMVVSLRPFHVDHEKFIRISVWTDDETGIVGVHLRGLVHADGYIVDNQFVEEG